MRRSLVAAVVALVLLAAPVSAQLFPTTPVVDPKPAETSDRVLMDATIWANPPFQQGLCMALGPGQVTVSVKRENDDVVQRPTEFRFYGFVADQDASIRLAVGPQEMTGTTKVLGVDHYCWQINIDAPEAERLSNAERSHYVQRITLKITVSP